MDKVYDEPMDSAKRLDTHTMGNKPRGHVPSTTILSWDPVSVVVSSHPLSAGLKVAAGVAVRVSVLLACCMIYMLVAVQYSPKPIPCTNPAGINKIYPHTAETAR